MGLPRKKHGKMLGGITGKGFMPGNNANPSGRPKGSVSLSTLLRNLLAKHPDEAEEIVMALVREGKGGSLGHIKEIFERTEGKVKDVVEHQGSSEYTVNFEHGAKEGNNPPAEPLPEADGSDL